MTHSGFDEREAQIKKRRWKKINKTKMSINQDNNVTDFTVWGKQAHQASLPNIPSFDICCYKQHSGKWVIMGNCKVAITVILIATLSALSHGLKVAVTGDNSIDLCHLNRSLTKTLKALLYAEQNILLMYKKVDFLKYKGK